MKTAEFIERGNILQRHVLCGGPSDGLDICMFHTGDLDFATGEDQRRWFGGVRFQGSAWVVPLTKDQARGFVRAARTALVEELAREAA